MNCADADLFIHALLDGELDAGHAREVEDHLAQCSDCSSKLAAFRDMRDAMAQADLKEAAPARLRKRLEASLPAAPPLRPIASPAGPTNSPWINRRINRRFFAGGVAAGVALSAAVAASLAIGVFAGGDDRLIANEIVSAHLRSLQPGHLTDVETSDQHTVKPWFNGKVDIAPPVIDLTAQGFKLIGGRLDEINGTAVAAIVFRRRDHVINLFVMRQSGALRRAALRQSRDGFNIRHWVDGDFAFWAVSDLNGAELDEFRQDIATALRSSAART